MFYALFMSDVVGFSKIVSIGNRADIDESDMLEYLAGDPSPGSSACILKTSATGKTDARGRRSNKRSVYKAGTTSRSLGRFFAHRRYGE